MWRLFIKRGVSEGEAGGIAPEAHWFISTRWAAVAVGTIVSLVAGAYGVLPPDVLARLLITIAGSAGLNIGFAIMAGHEACKPYLLALQMYADLAILTILLHLTGGVENPLCLSLLIHVALGGILLSRRQCYLVATAASVMFMLMAWGEWSDLLHHYFVPALPHGEPGWKADAAQNTFYVAGLTSLQTALFFFVAYIVTTLVERARFQERRLEALAAQARAERRLLEQALQTTGTALRVSGSNLRSRWMNGRWQEWFGTGDSGGLPLDRGSDRLRSGLATAGGMPVAAEISQAIECRSVAPDGIRVTEVVLPSGKAAPGNARSGRHDRVFRVTIAPLTSGDGPAGEFVELAQEITEQKQAEAQMMRAAKLAAVGELAGHVAHEVNNPIAIISAKGRLLLQDHRDEMSAKTAAEVNKIVEFADRVARIAQGLLSYCRPSAAVRTPISIHAPIRKALSMIEERATSGGVRIDERFGQARPTILANSSEMEEIFLNLFLNALDAMPAGGVLTIATAGPDDHRGEPAAPATLAPDGAAAPSVSVVIEDTGHGIAEEVRNEIFEPFFTTKEAGRGTGLGLAICLGIVRNHGGTIAVDSEVGRGTRFTVKLPAHMPNESVDTQYV
ncbi:MAG: hypothetical protein HY699_11870 [Deltaproteobacteria bacterium]|nr:hypothetical protein [Deltaproteobacteria bacterium]